MHHNYNDIRNRISTAPLWWDEVGVPRYCDFGPGEVNLIYATEVVFFAVACQSCGCRFNVALSWHPVHDCHSLSRRVKQNTLHYGDPPNTGCCSSGPTMNSNPLYVLEFWQRGIGDWERVSEFERPLATTAE